MSQSKLTQIRKRDSSIVPFDAGKIEQAIYKAFVATGIDKREIAAGLTKRVIELLEARVGEAIPTVEGVQDIVEEALMTGGYLNVAKAYVLYRQQRAEVRRIKGTIGVRDDLKLSINAITVLERRYLFKDEEGNVIETPMQLFRRVARTIAGQTDVTGGNHAF